MNPPLNSMAVNPKRLVLIASGACALAVVAFVLLVSSVARTASTSPGLDGPQLLSALKAFETHRQSRGEIVPARISLQTLIERGFIDPDKVSVPKGVMIVFHGDRDKSRSDSIVLEARLPDGTTMAVLADGSVQAVSQ